MSIQITLQENQHTWERAGAEYGLWSLGPVSTEYFLGPCGAAGSYFKIQYYLCAYQNPCLEQDSACLCHCWPHQDVISSFEVISLCSCWHSAVQLRHKHHASADHAPVSSQHVQ